MFKWGGGVWGSARLAFPETLNPKPLNPWAHVNHGVYDIRGTLLGSFVLQRDLTIWVNFCGPLLS